MPRTPGSAGARRPVLTWMLRVLRAVQLALMLCFVAYFVCVQVNAVAYLAGKNDPVIRGADPPIPLGSDLAAVGDIIIGLVFEAIAALIVFIVVLRLRGAVRKR
jgi:energy-converting hydrogenase Eha subunit E